MIGPFDKKWPSSYRQPLRIDPVTKEPVEYDYTKGHQLDRTVYEQFKELCRKKYDFVMNRVQWSFMDAANYQLRKTGGFPDSWVGYTLPKHWKRIHVSFRTWSDTAFEFSANCKRNKVPEAVVFDYFYREFIDFYSYMDLQQTTLEDPRNLSEPVLRIQSILNSIEQVPLEAREIKNRRYMQTTLEDLVKVARAQGECPVELVRRAEDTIQKIRTMNDGGR